MTHSLQSDRAWRSFVVALALLLVGLTAPNSAARASDRLLLEARDYPWSAIGRINTAGRGFCTGFMVAADKVLTAAHCLYSFRQGRWYNPVDVHFVAGYQRDTFLKHSRAKSYEVHKNYRPRKVPEVADTLRDWAVITLAKPIGKDVGWLGLAVFDRTTLEQIQSGAAVAVQAGYRRDRPHAISAGLRCEVLKVFGKGRGVLHSCDVVEGASGSPLLLVRDGRVSVLGLHTIRTENEDGTSRAGALTVSVFHPKLGTEAAKAAANQAGLRWGGGRSPGSDASDQPLPKETIDQLLSQNGRDWPGPDRSLTALP